MNLEGIDHLAIAVSDMEETIGWYTEVLGFKRLYPNQWKGVPAFIGLGSTAIALFPRHKGHALRSADGPMLHLAFRTDRAGFATAQKELNARGLSWRFEDHGIAHSIYFRDLNDLPLEITTYEVA